jgi:hypothetical protein
MSLFTGIISSSFKTLFTDAIDALLEDDGLTVPCQLVFVDSDHTECINCYRDVMTGRSNGIYKIGGPISFVQGNCPYCHGLGVLVTDNTLNLSLIVVWNYKEFVGWNKIPDDTMLPFGYCQTMSKLDTLSDIKRAKEIILNTDLSAYVKHRFVRISEPNPIGLGNDAYVITTWKRIE